MISVSEDLNAYLSGITKINRNRNQTLLNQVKELSALFNAHGINHVFTKGCALLASGYFKDFGERLIGDIDLLVEPTNLFKAEQLLLNLEYVSAEDYIYLENTRGIGTSQDWCIPIDWEQ